MPPRGTLHPAGDHSKGTPSETAVVNTAGEANPESAETVNLSASAKRSDRFPGMAVACNCNVMQSGNAHLPKPLTLAERKARVAALVAAGKVSAKRAALIDFREPTAFERALAQSLVPKARKALARKTAETA